MNEVKRDSPGSWAGENFLRSLPMKMKIYTFIILMDKTKDLSLERTNRAKYVFKHLQHFASISHFI